MLSTKVEQSANNYKLKSNPTDCNLFIYLSLYYCQLEIVKVSKGRKLFCLRFRDQETCHDYENRKLISLLESRIIFFRYPTCESLAPEFPFFDHVNIELTQFLLFTSNERSFFPRSSRNSRTTKSLCSVESGLISGKLLRVTFGAFSRMFMLLLPLNVELRLLLNVRLLLLLFMRKISVQFFFNTP